MKHPIAVLDDEKRMLEVVAMVLGERYGVTTFARPEGFLEALAKQHFDILITDLKMPGLSGLEVLQRARQLDPELQVILMTAHASIPTAVKAMQQGAFDFIEKPFDNDVLRNLVQRALDMSQLRRQNRYLRSEVSSQYRPESIVAESPAMQQVLELVRKVARSRSTVLITGESGSGKEIIARALHFYSNRLDGPFVAVNSKAIADSLVESELFGHERGAFTGAHRARPGLFERADGGTLFLDEIGEISGDFQTKLLRVLETKEVRRVGGERTIGVDVRVVAATNRDLKAEVASGNFRQDLYFRLQVVPMALPPLRQRPQDVLPLAQHFLQQMRAGEPRRPAPLGFTSEAEQRLLSHPWPGNVRELENAVERGTLLAEGDHIDQDDLLLDTAESSPASAHTTLKAVMDAAAATHIRQVLAQVNGSRTETAERLGIERTTLYRLMRRLDIE